MLSQEDPEPLGASAVLPLLPSFSLLPFTSENKKVTFLSLLMHNKVKMVNIWEQKEKQQLLSAMKRTDKVLSFL